MASLPNHTFQSLFLASHCNVRNPTNNLAYMSGTPLSITDHLVANSNISVTGPFIGSSSNIIRSGTNRYTFSTMDQIPMYAISNVCQPLAVALMSNAFYSKSRLDTTSSFGDDFHIEFQRFVNSFNNIFNQYALDSSSNFNKTALSNAVFSVAHGDRETTRFEYFRSNDSANSTIRSNLLDMRRIAYHAYAPCYKLMEYNANLPTSVGSVMAWDKRVDNFMKYVEDAQNLILLLKNNTPTDLRYADDLNRLKEAIQNATMTVKLGLSNYGMSANLQLGASNVSSTSNLYATNDMLLSRREKLIVMTDYMIYQNQQVQHARMVMYAWIVAYVVVTTAFVFFVVVDRRDVVAILASIILLSFAFAVVWKTVSYLRQIGKK